MSDKAEAVHVLYNTYTAKKKNQTNNQAFLEGGLVRRKGDRRGEITMYLR